MTIVLNIFISSSTSNKVEAVVKGKKSNFGSFPTFKFIWQSEPQKMGSIFSISSKSDHGIQHSFGRIPQNANGVDRIGQYFVRKI